MKPSRQQLVKRLLRLVSIGPQGPHNWHTDAGEVGEWLRAVQRIAKQIERK